MTLIIKKTAVEKARGLRFLLLAVLWFSAMTFSIQSAELAYYENFDHGGSMATGWEAVSKNTNKWPWRAVLDSGSDYSMYCDSNAAGLGEIKEWLYMPSFSVPCPPNNPRLQFYINYNTQGGTNNWVEVWYAKSSDTNFTVLIKRYTSTVSGMQFCDLSACAGDPGIHIAFIYSGNQDGSVYVDDVKITRDVAYTNVKSPSNGDAVFRYLDVGGIVGHTGIFCQKGPNPVVKDGVSFDSSMGWVIQSCGSAYADTHGGYSVDLVPFSGNSVGGRDFLQGSTYWGAYTLGNVTKTIRAEIIFWAKSHIGKEDYPSIGLFFSNAYKNPGNYFGYSEYPNGSFRCDGFVEYCYEKAFGDPWLPGLGNKGIFEDDDPFMSPEGQMRWMNNESIAHDGYDNSYHGGGRDAAEDISPPTVSIVSGPSGTIDSHSVTFSVGVSDNYTPDADVFYKTKLDSYTDWDSSWTKNTLRSWSYPSLPDGLYTFRIKARDLVGNESGETTASFTITTPVPPDGGGGGGGGGGAVGPLAVSISALLGWWKRRKQKQV